MKNMKKLMLSLLLACVMVLGISLYAPAADVSYSFTDNSITVNWVKPNISDRAQLTSYAIYDSNTRTYVVTGIPAYMNSYTVSGLAKGYVGRWSVRYNYLNPSGREMTDMSIGYLNVNTTPAALTKDQFGIGGVLTSTKKVYFAAQKSNGMTGTQLQLYKGKKKVGTYSFYSSSEYIPVSDDAVYKYRVRAYYTNSDTQQTFYSAWSPYRYFDKYSGKIEYNYSTNGCDITLKKVKNVKSYTIQVSKSKDSGFKKTAKVTVSGKSAKVHINKMGKSLMANKTTYYIRIVPNIIAGSKTVKSDVIGTYSLYNSFR